MPNIRWLLALITRMHRFVYRKSGGAIGGRLPGKRFLLLTTVGRRTGMRRVMPLLYVPKGDGSFLVVGSNAGDDKPPAWLLNLDAQPAARVQVDGDHHEVVARRAEGAEAGELWPKLEQAYPPYRNYRERTSREIPIVVLEPTTGSA